MDLAETLPARAGEPAAPLAPSWPLWERLAFRFAAAYFAIDSFPFPLGFLPGTSWAAGFWDRAQDKAILWSAAHLFGLGALSSAETGSGDRPYDLVDRTLVVALAALATAVLTLAGTRQVAHPRALLWVRALVRYTLSVAVFSYGISKLMPVGQFPPLCYDVPVKLYTTSLLCGALFLAAPDAGRLLDLLVFNRVAAGRRDARRCRQGSRRCVTLGNLQGRGLRAGRQAGRGLAGLGARRPRAVRLWHPARRWQLRPLAGPAG